MLLLPSRFNPPIPFRNCKSRMDTQWAGPPYAVGVRKPRSEYGIYSPYIS